MGTSAVSLNSHGQDTARKLQPRDKGIRFMVQAFSPARWQQHTMKTTQKSIITSAVADPPSMAALFAQQADTLPDYDPQTEITIMDLIAANKDWTRGRAVTEMAHSGWVGHEVRLPSGRRATAYRPK